MIDLSPSLSPQSDHLGGQAGCVVVEYQDAERHSSGSVKAAGKTIIAKHASATPEVIEAFRVAYEWRDSFRKPMHDAHRRVRGLATRKRVPIVTAARLKRMQSIRAKLMKRSLSLYQMQDIGGCRVILDDMEEARRVVDGLDRIEGFHVRRTDDYVATPRASGYRSIHCILKCDEAPYVRHAVEIQVRTQLQHAWATAVETIGLINSENLKAGDGSETWLRLFQLMAGEIAETETMPAPACVPADAAERRREIADLAGRLEAPKILAGLRRALQHTEGLLHSDSRYFLVQIDTRARKTKVRPLNATIQSLSAYRDDERDGINTVLVEIDRVQDLRAAYPNYFLDIRAFENELKKALPQRMWQRDYSWVANWKNKQ